MIPLGLIKVARREIPSMARDEYKKQLTVFPVSTSSYSENPDPIRLYAEDENWFAVPRGFFNNVIKKRHDPTFEFNASSGVSDLKPSTQIVYRPGQKETVDEAVSYLNSVSAGGVILEMSTGAGKSPTSLEVARQLGRKTLVIVHTSVLMEQWILEIKKFHPAWSVGKIRGDVIDINGNDVCVGMLQSLALKDDYPESLFREFGTIILDEVQLMGSQEFGKVLFKFCSKNIIGLTGTLKRADKAENVFLHGTGHVVRSMDRVEILKPIVYMVDTKYVITGIPTAFSDKDKNKLLSKITQDDARNGLIVKDVVNAAMKGRHVLVLTERVAHVSLLYAEIVKVLIPQGIKVGMMIGAMKQDQRDYAKVAQVIVATKQLLAVGFNNTRLDTLIMATPIQGNNLIQACGRILRNHEGKASPVVVDYYESSTHMSSELARFRYFAYRKKNWTVNGSDRFSRTFNNGDKK